MVEHSEEFGSQRQKNWRSKGIPLKSHLILNHCLGWLTFNNVLTLDTMTCKENLKESTKQLSN